MAKVNVMKGVSGAVLASADGLLVAGQVAAPLKADTIAAFLPQIFSRLTQSAKEMQLGDLQTVFLTLQSGQCQIFKCGSLFFGALGKPGENLPSSTLNLIANELAKINR